MSAFWSSLSDVEAKMWSTGLELPGIGIVAAEHDLAGADLRRQMADRFGREDQGIEIDLLEIFRRRLLELHVGIAALGPDHAGMVRTIGIGRQVPAAMGGDHFQSGKAVQRALEDEMRERYRRVERIADGVAEPAVARQPLAELGHALRMDEQGHAEFLRLGPNRMEFRVGEVDAAHRAADRGSLQALLLDRGLKLLHGEIRRLQGKRSEGGETIRL